MLLWLGLALLIATLAIRLCWKGTPGFLMLFGIGLALHLIAADIAPTDRRPPILAVTVFWAGLWVLALLAVVLRPLVTKAPPQ